MPPKKRTRGPSPRRSSGQIRQTFLDFFRDRGHTIVPSMSLVPGGDETLLFTNSGMVQFKDIFLGTGRRPYTRVVDSQKCMRVAGKHNDLDDVGRDDSHHTFFEMLGNWSFGDYYKAEAISWAWELFTEVWSLPKDRLYATCFEDELGEIARDDEAAGHWVRQPGFDSSHVVYFGRKDNFWEMADTGPCGPDSEIHIDLGPEACNLQGVPGHTCRVNGDCTRFLELWNLVFIQYNRTGPSSLEPLPKKHVDTGLGLERLVSVLQGTGSTYRTDLFMPIIETTRGLAGHSEAQMLEHWTPYRVIADHSRAAAFLIGDGVVPGNLGRNYVTRMIIRRASLFGAKLGFEEPFLAPVVQTVIEQYGEAYPELAQNQGAILQSVTDEERRFQRTVEVATGAGEEILRETRQAGSDEVPGERVFWLFSTYGLPLEIFKDLAGERGLRVEEAGFQRAMEEHRRISGPLGVLAVRLDDLTLKADARVEAGRWPASHYQELLEQLRRQGTLPDSGVRYDPYGSLQFRSTLAGLITQDGPADSAAAGEPVVVVLPETHFYVEAGGQVSDTGRIVSANGRPWEIRVEDTQSPVDGVVIHLGSVVKGEPRAGDEVLAEIDAERRRSIMRNHTATHLLHAALRSILGNHARQAGSLVAPDRLRFDFTHPEPMTPAQVRQVEQWVNREILAGHDLAFRQQARAEATQAGAMALFGETYGETVRTISIGEPRISYELCGGTHMPNTGAIGAFLITSEGSVASGIRRIEAVTGEGALQFIRSRLDALERAAARLGVSPTDLDRRVQDLQAERDQLLRVISGLRSTVATEHFRQLAPQQVDGVPVVAGLIPEVGADELRRLIDRFRAVHPSGVVVLASAPDDQPIIVAAVTQDLVERGLHAGELVKSIAQQVGGGGGGRPTLAQAGGTDPTRLPQALALVPGWVEAHLE